jgi:hypothetical protein
MASPSTIVSRLKSSAYAERPKICYGRVGPWEVGLSYRDDATTVRSCGEPVLHMSMILRAARSTAEDWALVGVIAAAAGAPEDALITPIESTPPTAVHHWSWFASGRSLPADQMRTVREALGILQ